MEVFIKLQFDEILKKEMLHVLVKDRTGKQYVSLVDPAMGKFILTVNGGQGGEGGEGGQGGQGGDDSYRSISGNGAQGGSGGDGGDGGNGGSIVVYHDPALDISKFNLVFRNEGGKGGKGGKGGQGGSKGYHNNATNGIQGSAGNTGQEGMKGGEIRFIKKAVE